MARRVAPICLLFSVVLVVGGLFAPATAHHKSGHEGGPQKSGQPSGGGGYTEDNDHNDGGTPNNLSDSGDNAHPSGKDRSVEHGNSGNQGHSSSDPDDDGRGPDRSNGGPDKPNGSGGVDLADQDRNNGCGNDDDFEDDNEGWCGKPTDSERPPKVPPDVDDEDLPPPRDRVLDNYVPRDDVLANFLTRPRTKKPEVASDLLERSASGAGEGEILPFTGADLALFVMTGVGLIASGGVLVRSRRR
ncbi:MAG: hypothetical protein M3280_11155 [Actinomycetota bacterium]|nr:hypothetical protein [Actinomycetota bacterium]